MNRRKNMGQQLLQQELFSFVGFPQSFWRVVQQRYVLGFKQSGIQSFRIADPILNEDLFFLAEQEVKRIEVTNENIDNYMPLLKMYDRADILNDLV